MFLCSKQVCVLKIKDLWEQVAVCIECSEFTWSVKLGGLEHVLSMRDETGFFRKTEKIH